MTDRSEMQPSRVGAMLLWAINKTSGADPQVVDNRGFDPRMRRGRRERSADAR